MGVGGGPISKSKVGDTHLSHACSILKNFLWLVPFPLRVQRGGTAQMLMSFINMNFPSEMILLLGFSELLLDLVFQNNPYAKEVYGGMPYSALLRTHVIFSSHVK